MKRLWLRAAAACALLASPLALTLAGCSKPKPAPQASQGPTPDSLQAPRMGTWGVNLANRDTAVKPGDDFFRYADGKGVDAMQIPPDRSRFGAFDTLVELSSARQRALIESPGTGQPGSEEAKIKALYKSFMDEKGIDALGAKPLQPELDAIKAAQTKDDMARLMGKGADSFYGAFFGVGITTDAKDPDRYTVAVGQNGLNLPDRDYYLTPGFADKKAKYQVYVADTLKKIGWADPESSAKTIVDLETAIAKASWTKVQQRDDVKTYNPMSPAELEKLAPGFPWQAFLDGAGLPPVPRLVVAEKTAFPKIAAIYAKTPMDTLKAWMAFTLVSDAASDLSKDFDDAHFAFYAHELQGVPQQRERWKRATSLVSGQMGEALGHLYADHYFPASSKAQMLDLVHELEKALGERIKKLEWMSEPTKQKALAKLAKLTVKIGYPDKWRDYSKLVQTPDDLYGNNERGLHFEWRRQVDRLNQPVDRAEWDMTPQTVNAYYDPTKNEIVFPAAILAPPFFDPKADPAVNYGAIGGVIGHEMTHGFDDQGRKYDGTGKLTDWWTKEDGKRFDERAKRLVGQYSAFEPLPGAHVQGALTLGENIADLGGMLLGYDAYHASLNGKPAPTIDGLTGDQRVFLGWAQVWKSKIRPDALRQRMATDPHSPDMLRVNGVVHNVDAWYDAWGVKPGEKLYLAPDQRVKIW